MLTFLIKRFTQKDYLVSKPGLHFIPFKVKQPFFFSDQIETQSPKLLLLECKSTTVSDQRPGTNLFRFFFFFFLKKRYKIGLGHFVAWVLLPNSKVFYFLTPSFHSHSTFLISCVHTLGFIFSVFRVVTFSLIIFCFKPFGKETINFKQLLKICRPYFLCFLVLLSFQLPSCITFPSLSFLHLLI